jgi:hypothetical protein
MDSKNRSILYDRYEKVSMALNGDAYEMQMKGRNGRPLIQFIPCSKAIIFTAALADIDHHPALFVLADANKTMCSCHPDMTPGDLSDLYLSTKPPEGDQARVAGCE